MKRIAVLGSTGSVGESALDLVSLHPERFEVVALGARSNVERLMEQVRTHRPRLVALEDAKAAEALRRNRPGTEVVSGLEGMVQAATFADADIVVSAVSGAAGLAPTYAAVESGKDVALANKESMVMAGDILMPLARRKQTRILPVDSEHAALHQILRGFGPEDISRLILTASGGPFFLLEPALLPRVTPEQALRHPTWEMGPKITVDSATLMNKGLEVIEAHHFFQKSADDIAVAIHPQSVIHSIVEFRDGTMQAQMSITDMRSAIFHALAYPECLDSRLPGLDLFALKPLEFFKADLVRFPCLRLAYEALRAGGTAPAILNAANEVAVEQFLAELIPFSAIPNVIETVLQASSVEPVLDLGQLLETDAIARRRAAQACQSLADA